MEDLEASLEKAIAAQAECEMIASLATDEEKKAVYRNLSGRYQGMDKRSEGSHTPAAALRGKTKAVEVDVV